MYTTSVKDNEKFIHWCMGLKVLPQNTGLPWAPECDLTLEIGNLVSYYLLDVVS